MMKPNVAKEEQIEDVLNTLDLQMQAIATLLRFEGVFIVGIGDTGSLVTHGLRHPEACDVCTEVYGSVGSALELLKDRINSAEEEEEPCDDSSSES